VTDYPNVKNAHIVPRAYLANWAVDGKIARKRPDGTEIDDIEWTLSEVESNAAPFLGSLDERWLLLGVDKLYLATLFAFQLLRGPRWSRSEYDWLKAVYNPTGLKLSPHFRSVRF
jgi:hypothetical protein